MIPGTEKGSFGESCDNRQRKKHFESREMFSAIVNYGILETKIVSLLWVVVGGLLAFGLSTEPC